MMQRILKIGGWSIFVMGVFALLIFINAGYDNIATAPPEISIENPDNHNFVTNEKVTNLMNDLGYSFDGQPMGEIELARIENEVATIPGVKSVEAYKYTDGTVHLDIVQQKPVARIVLSGGKMGCYIDDEGEIIPLSSDYVAKVPVFTGNIHEPYTDIPSISEITVNDSISKLHILDEIYTLAMAISNNDFLKAQIVQIYVNNQYEFELIPRVGNHRVLFGGIEDVDSKLLRLHTFYKSSTLNIKELNLYDTLNLKYKDQIVCAKR